MYFFVEKNCEREYNIDLYMVFEKFGMKGGGFMCTEGNSDSCRRCDSLDVPPRWCTIKLNKEDYSYGRIGREEFK